MSRGFVKESDQEELPLIPERAPLPPGVSNYVTESGLAELEAERASLKAEKAGLATDNEDEHRRSLTVLDGKLALLNKRIVTARVLPAADQPQDEVRFGATVTLRFDSGDQTQRWRIVGVDEADVKAGKLAFTAPLARKLTGARVGDKIVFPMGGRRREITVSELSYAPSA